MSFRRFWSSKGMLFGMGALACFLVAIVPLGMSALDRFSEAMARRPLGLFGMDGEAPDEHSERLWVAALAHRRSLIELHIAEALAVLGVLFAVRAATQTRATIRSWHWLAFGGFGATLGALAVTIWAPDALPSRSAFVAFALLALALPCADLARPRRGPGRVFAWLTLALACLLLCIVRFAR